MEVWHLVLGVIGLLVGIGTLLTPIVMAAQARDRSLTAMVNSAKEDAVMTVKTATDPIHERINRVRDEYVREDHLNAHLIRIEKRFDEMAGEMRRGSERVDKGLDEIRKILQGRGHSSAD